MGAGEAPGVWRGAWAADLDLAGVVGADELRALVNGVDPHRRRPADRSSRTQGTCDRRDVVGAEVGVVAVGVRHPGDVGNGVDRGGRSDRGRGRLLGGARGVRPPTTPRHPPPGRDRAVSRSRDVRAPHQPRRRPAAAHPLPDPQRRTPRRRRHVAFDANPLHVWAKATGTVFLNELERTLTQQLGVAWGPERNGCREIVGFTREQLRAFSKRTIAIETHLEAAGEIVFASGGARTRSPPGVARVRGQRKDPSLDAGAASGPLARRGHRRPARTRRRRR